MRPASAFIDGSAVEVGVTIGLMIERIGMKSEIGMFDVEEELCLFMRAREPFASADTWLLGITLDPIVLGVLPILRTCCYCAEFLMPAAEPVESKSYCLDSRSLFLSILD